MSRIALVTDSTAYLPESILDQYSITVAPLVLIWGEKTFEDGIDIQSDDFYTRLHKAAVMPSTSQATIARFHQIFDDLLIRDYQILTMLISSSLSGTVSSALQAREMLPAGAPIEIVDTRSTSMAMGFQVMQVARAIEQGATLPESAALAQQLTQQTGIVFAVDTLEFLHRGGRIGSASRFMGTALNIKPILELREGKVEALERVRTRKKSLHRLIELVNEQTGGRKPVRLAAVHANAAADAQAVLTEALQHLEVVESYVCDLSPVIGTHTGPGTVGLAYIAGA